MPEARLAVASREPHPQRWEDLTSLPVDLLRVSGDRPVTGIGMTAADAARA